MTKIIRGTERAPGPPEAVPLVESSHVIRLSVEDQRRFAEALINPPEPNEAMKRAAQQYRLLIDPRD